MEDNYKQSDFDNFRCPECGGKLNYEFGAVRCENDDWFAGDGEIEEFFNFKDGRDKDE